MGTAHTSVNNSKHFTRKLIKNIVIKHFEEDISVHLNFCFLFINLVDEMIAEVDIDGDGRIDFDGN